MSEFIILFAVAMIVSSCGFKKFIWFISIGYGFSMAAIGVALLVMALVKGQFNALVAIQCALLLVYGCRLGGYLLKRELKSTTYNALMKTETKDGSDMPLVAKLGIWVSCALLYVCEASPVLFRIQNNVGIDALGVVGVCIMAGGILLESLSDKQKSAAKAVNPKRFVDTGLFSVVRCPNYLGEVTCWTGMLISGMGIYQGALQWIVALIGWASIVYIMFGGARRLEIRQNKNYGADPEYQAYVKKTPIILPLVPLYSVEKYKWLVG